MENVAIAQTLASASPSAMMRFAPRLVLPFAFFIAVWFGLCRQLSAEWSLNEQYNYGWFVPFFALYLFWLRWQDRPTIQIQHLRFEIRTRRVIAASVAVPALFLLLPIRLFEIGNPDWRPLGWIHTASLATVTLLYVWYAGGAPWLRHFAFPIAFFFVAVPWVHGMESPIIQGLMRLVATVAAETITLFGIPAQLEGNLIRVSSGLVGVNEACSGVRSLQTSLMIGLLFGELKRLSILRRIALVAGAVGIALIANFLRAVFLVWIAAEEGVPEIGRWHDIVGYAIVALVFAGSFGLAYLLGRKKPSSFVMTGSPRDESVRMADVSAAAKQWQLARLPSSYFVAALCWVAAVEISAHLWYRAHENNLVESTRWEVQWPTGAPNFRKLKIDDEVRRQLRFDRGYGASWTWPAAITEGSKTSHSKPVLCVLYFFRWNPRRNSALLANLHRPDVCLPSVGWRQAADNGVHTYPVAPAFALPFRHFEFRRSTPDNPAQQVAHAFYCLWEDRTTNPSVTGAKLPQMAGAHSAWTRAERIRTVLEGRRHLGQRVMEFIALGQGSLDSDEATAHFARELPELIKIETNDRSQN